MKAKVQDDDAEAQWVHKVNELAKEIDQVAASMHPTAWSEELADLHRKFEKLAKGGPK